MTTGDPWWHYRRSLASRVTILTTMAVGLSIAAISLGAYVTVRHQLQASMDNSLLRRARAVAEDTAFISSDQDSNLIPTWAIGAADIRLAWIRKDHSVWFPDRASDSPPKVGLPEYTVADGDASYSVRTITTGGDQYRVAAVPLPNSLGAIVLATSLEPEHRMYQRLGIVMLSFGSSGVILAGLFGWGVATGGLRPVRRLTAQVEEIARTEDLTPMPVDGADEIARLTGAFNQLLTALAGSRDRQRQLVADAGHELRTPLTSMRTNIDLLTQADASLSGPQRAELLADVRAQMEELTTLIGDLVELARDEPPTPVVEAVDLPTLLDGALERVRRRGPSITWDVDAHEPWWVLGEAGGIERAITNLLDNAVKWSPEGGTVHVRLSRGTLTVDDEGPGIPEADRPFVFDRFYRSTESRAMSGSGLGLAIVRQVAERSGGTVTATESPYGGARLMLWLPGSASPMPRTTPAGGR